MEINSYIWNQHGDHGLVRQIPDEIKAQIPAEHHNFGCIVNGNQMQIIPPGTRLIECGGNFFAVEESYYHEFYEEIQDETPQS